jgi:hypothetical protein
MDIITIFCEKCPDIFHDINHEHCIKCETHHSLIGKKYYCTDCNKCYQTKLLTGHCDICERCSNHNHCYNCDRHHRNELLNICKKCNICCINEYCRKCSQPNICNIN